MWFLYIFLFILLILIMLSSYLIKSLLYNKLKSEIKLNDFTSRTFTEEWYHRIENWYAITKKEYFSIESVYGYALSCYKIDVNPKKIAVILHGVTTNKEFIKKFAYLYYQLGFTVIAADMRHHGLSGGKNITYGYYEKFDLESLINYIKKEYGHEAVIGLHGESMGASIILSYASMVNDNCQFYIADCPFSSLYDQILKTLKKTLRTPGIINRIIIEFTNLICRIFFRFDIKALEIKNHINKVKNPILFINARNDDYIPIEMTSLLYEQSSGVNKEIHWFDTGYHAGSFNYQPEEYMTVVNEFIDKYVEI